MKYSLLVVCLLVACGRDGQRAAATSPCSDHTISDEGVGPVQLGLDVDSVSRVCQVARDTVQQDQEGNPSRRVSVLVGADTVVAEVDSGRVWRLNVSSPAFSIGDIRVGSPLPSLAAQPGAHGAVGEGRLFVLIPRLCGVSFRIANAPTLTQSAFDSLALRQMPASMVVDQILVFGCSAPAS